jgi:hypothetical protein
LKEKIGRFQKTIKIFVLVPILIFCFFFAYINASAVEITGIDFLGQVTLPKGLYFQETPVGGLSGITYDAKNKVYYVISDDRSGSRFYTLKIDLSKGSLKNGDVIPVGVTKILDKSGNAFPPGTLDTEGIALKSKGSVFISSEGNSGKLIQPFIKEFSLSSGKELTTLPIPNKFLNDKNSQQGIRNNLAFEGLTITPNKKYLYTATENALIQDGSEAKPKTSTLCRILQYNLLTKKPEKEFLYPTEPVKPFFNVFNIFASGLSDLLALDNQGHFLTIERSFTGLMFSIKLFQVSLKGADDIHNIDSLFKINSKNIKPVKKKLLLDLSNLHILLDNIEGLTLGPVLLDGQRSLIVISDNNFKFIQRTQILAFRINTKPLLMRLLYLNKHSV